MNKESQFITQGTFIEAMKRQEKKKDIKNEQIKEELSVEEKRKLETIEKLLDTINFDDPRQWSLDTFKAIYHYLQEIKGDSNDLGGYTLVCQSVSEYMKHHSTGEISDKFASFWDNRQAVNKDGYLYAYGEEIKKMLNEWINPKIDEVINNFKQTAFSRLPKNFYKNEENFKESKNIDVFELFIKGAQNIREELEKYLKNLLLEFVKSLPDDDSFRFYKKREGSDKLLEELNIKDASKDNLFHNASHIFGTMYNTQRDSFTQAFDESIHGIHASPTYKKMYDLCNNFAMTQKNSNSLNEMNDKFIKRGFDQIWKEFIGEIEKNKK